MISSRKHLFCNRTTENNMTTQTKLSEKDFVNAAFIFLSKRRFFRIITGMMIFITAINIVLLFTGSKSNSSNFYFVPIFLALFFCLIYYDASKNYRKTPRIQENIRYDFNEDALRITGESFRSELSWDKVYRISHERKWLFIWHNQQNAHVIPARDFPPGLLVHVKSIADRYKVRNNL